MGGKTLYYTRPEDCFTSELLNKSSGKLAMPAMSINARVGWDVGLRIAGVGPITEPLAVAFKNSRVSQVEIKSSELKRQLLTIAELKSSFVKSTDEACVSALSPKNKPKRQVVIETLSADSLTLTFKNAQGQDVALSVGLLTKLFPSVNFKNQTEWTGAISFQDDPHILAVKTASVPETLAYAGAKDIDFRVDTPDSYYQTLK